MRNPVISLRFILTHSIVLPRAGNAHTLLATSPPPGGSLPMHPPWRQSFWRSQRHRFCAGLLLFRLPADRVRRARGRRRDARIPFACGMRLHGGRSATRLGVARYAVSEPRPSRCPSACTAQATRLHRHARLPRPCCNDACLANRYRSRRTRAANGTAWRVLGDPIARHGMQGPHHAMGQRRRPVAAARAAPTSAGRRSCL